MNVYPREKVETSIVYLKNFFLFGGLKHTFMHVYFELFYYKIQQG